MGVVELIIIAIVVIATVLSIVLRKTPSTPNLTPSQLSNVPVAEQGKFIPVVLGRAFIAQPNVVYWGNVVSEPIYMKTGGKS